MTLSYPENCFTLTMVAVREKGLDGPWTATYDFDAPTIAAAVDQCRALVQARGDGGEVGVLWQAHAPRFFFARRQRGVYLSKVHLSPDGAAQRWWAA